MPVRRLNPSEVPNLTPVNVQEGEGGGTTPLERATIQNLVSSPESARKFLESRGYQVRPYGEGYNFAVRKSDSDHWRPVDPRGLDAWDITDLLGDLGVGLISGLGATAGGILGAPGGPAGVVAGSVAGGAAAGGAGEALRQGLGTAVGIPDNVNLPEIAVSGAIGGAFPAVGGAVGAAGRGVSRAVGGTIGKEVGSALSGLGAVVAGTQPLGQAMTRGEVLAARAKIPAAKLPSTEAVARRLNSVVNRLWNKGNAHIFELEQASKLAKIAEDQGVTVDLRAPLEALDRFTPKPGPEVSRTTTRRILTEAEVKAETAARKTGFRTDFTTGPPPETTFFDVGTQATTAGKGTREVATTRTITEAQDVLSQEAAELAVSEPSLPKTIQGVIGRVNALLGDADHSAVSPLTATKIKRQLQKIAFSKGAFENEPIGDAFTRIVTTAGHDVRRATETAMDAAGFGDYARLMQVGANRFGYLKDMYEAAGKDPEQALRFVRGVYGGNFRIQALHDFEKAMGIPAGGLSKAVEQARIGEVAFGPGRRGSAPLLPRFTAVGTLFGASFAANQLGLDIGPLTPLVGLALASPRSVLALTRLGQRFGGAATLTRLPLSQGAELLKETVKILALSAAQGTGRRVASEDSQGRRRAVFMGE